MDHQHSSVQRSRADARRIREELDEFGSRKPIDVIAANRPVLILDETTKRWAALQRRFVGGV
jgi:restriction endonuclease